MNNFRTYFTDALLITLVISITLIASLSAFAKKSIKFSDTNGLVAASVQKKPYTVASLSSGTVLESKVGLGTHVKKGDKLLTLGNEVLTRQIAALETFSDDNVSAQTQLVDLRLQQEALVLYAPIDGTVSKVPNQGQFVNRQELAVELYADADPQLLAYVNPTDYVQLQKRSEFLTATTARNDKEYSIIYRGLLQSVDSEGANKGLIGIYFSFSDPADAQSLLQNERMTIKIVDTDTTQKKPIDWFIDAYRALSE